MKKFGVLFLALFAIALIFAPFNGEAKSDNGQKNGVPHVLKEILSELQNLSGMATIKGAVQIQGLVTNPIPESEHELVNVPGSGAFVAARVVKQGGDSDITFVILEIDGKTVVNRSFAALKNWGMTQNNPFGVVVFTNGDIDTVTIGFPQPITFEDSIVLKAVLDETETGVVQIIGTVIYGE